MSDQSAQSDQQRTDPFPAVYLPATPSVTAGPVRRALRSLFRRRGFLGWHRRRGI